MPECYYCNQEATSEEHIPPKCIFATEEIKEMHLIKVPSCDKHNGKKTGEDEYFRTIFALHVDGGEKSYKLFDKKAYSSLHNSPSKAKSLFAGSSPVVYGGLPTRSVLIDQNRIQKYFNLMAHGLFFHETGKKCDFQFAIDPISLRPNTSEYNEMRKYDYYLSKDLPKKGYYPETFFYQLIYEKNIFLGFRMVFMGGIIFIAILMNELKKD